MIKLQRAAALSSIAFLLACSSSLGPRDRSPVRFREPAPPPMSGAYPNWPMPPDEAAELLTHAVLERREVEDAGGGTTGAEKHGVYFPAADVAFDVKWKEFPGRLDGFNNSPRKEIAAYAIQRILLDPEDYVAPAAAIRCAPIEQYRALNPTASPTVDGTQCVLGVISIWVFGVTVPEELYDEGRFCSDPQYAYYMSNLNLFTYLVDHRDGRDGNFLVSEDDSRRQVFSVDNGIAFGPWVFNYFVPNWTHLRVAAVRAESIERLRAVRREDLEFLQVVAQLEANEAGILRSVPPGTSFDPNEGASERDGSVQFGLTTAEIDAVYRRIRELIEAVDAGRVPVF
jgi:hypothetical protein